MFNNFTELHQKKQEENPNAEPKGILGDVGSGSALASWPLPAQLSNVGGMNKLTRSLVT